VNKVRKEVYRMSQAVYIYTFISHWHAEQQQEKKESQLVTIIQSETRKSSQQAGLDATDQTRFDSSTTAHINMAGRVCETDGLFCLKWKRKDWWVMKVVVGELINWRARVWNWVKVEETGLQETD